MRCGSIIAIVLGLNAPLCAKNLPCVAVHGFNKIYWTAPNWSLAIGVLGRTTDGQYVLGLGSYAGASHVSVVKKLIEGHQLEAIEWLGELRYRIGSQSRVLIAEANETSGFYHGLESGQSAVKFSVPIGNNVNQIPQAWRDGFFTGWSYHQSLPLHLDLELNSMRKSNLRHDVGNAVQVWASFLRFISSSDLEQRNRILEGINQGSHESFRLLGWLVRAWKAEGSLSAHELVETENLINLILGKRLSLERLDDFDQTRLKSELEVALEKVDPENAQLVRIIDHP